jgi:PHD/YefM family antitoxin component YafN of YafNO toxin-antitoxin module
VSIESWQVSDQYLDLVFNLTPPGRRYLTESPSAHRERLVLIVLAYLADDEGRCTASVTDIAAYTTLTAPAARAVLLALETEHGFVTITRNTNTPNVYTLRREVLESNQLVALLRRGVPSVELLSVYGLDIRSINALRRGQISTLEELGAELDRYRRSGSPLPLHRYLDIRGMGERSARKVVATYSAWQAENAETGSVAPSPSPVSYQDFGTR